MNKYTLGLVSASVTKLGYFLIRKVVHITCDF